MTLASPFVDISHNMTRLHDTAPGGLMPRSMSEIAEERPHREEEIIYVLVVKDVKESESTLKWALRNLGAKKLCILHVHQPSQKIPIMGTKFSISRLEDHQVRTYHNTERQHMHNLLKLASKGFTITFVNTHSVQQQISQAQTTLASVHDIFDEAQKSGLDICYATVSDDLPLDLDRSLNHDQHQESLLQAFGSYVDQLIGKLVAKNAMQILRSLA